MNVVSKQNHCHHLDVSTDKWDRSYSSGHCWHDPQVHKVMITDQNPHQRQCSGLGEQA